MGKETFDRIRVRMRASGMELTILAGQFDSEHMEKLSKDAVGKNGHPLPPKYRETPEEAKARRTRQATTTTTTKADQAKNQAKEA